MIDDNSKDYLFDLNYRDQDRNCKRFLQNQLIYVLSYYGLNAGYIGMLTGIEHKTVAKYKNICYMVNRDFLDEKQKKPDCRRTSKPNSILKNVPCVNELYSKLVVLYIRFHKGRPSKNVDLSAFLKSWIYARSSFNFIYNDLQKYNKLVNINNFFVLCRSLNESLITMPDSDFSVLEYSKNHKCFYIRSIMNIENNEKTELLSMKTISECLNKKEEPNCLKHIKYLTNKNYIIATKQI